LNFKNDVAVGVERGKAYSGIHHIGFQVERLEAISEKLAAAGARRRDDVNQALGVGHGRYANVEVKYSGPDSVMLDVSETGWGRHVWIRPCVSEPSAVAAATCGTRDR